MRGKILFGVAIEKGASGLKNVMSREPHPVVEVATISFNIHIEIPSKVDLIRLRYFGGSQKLALKNLQLHRIKITVSLGAKIHLRIPFNSFVIEVTLLPLFHHHPVFSKPTHKPGQNYQLRDKFSHPPWTR
jgi:hypothetical protein